jgi:hypothetical protein
MCSRPVYLPPSLLCARLRVLASCVRACACPPHLRIIAARCAFSDGILSQWHPTGKVAEGRPHVQAHHHLGCVGAVEGHWIPRTGRHPHPVREGFDQASLTLIRDAYLHSRHRDRRVNLSTPHRGQVVR